MTTVRYGSILASRGLERGDVIISLNKKPINSLTDLLKELSRPRTQRGHTLSLFVKRDQKMLKMDYRLLPKKRAPQK